MRVERLARWTAENWFLPVATLLLLAAWGISRSVTWATSGSLEAALLFDACITLPALYVLCYRRSLPKWQLGLRAVGLACLGIYLLGYLIPPEAQVLLPSFALGRMIGLALLVLIEVRLLIAALRMVFTREVTAEALSKETGAPPLVAKLMIIEARFWTAVWRFLRR